jgi:hypothetical protein
MASTATIHPCTIANGQTVSNAVDLGENGICGLIIPASFTGTTIKFQTSDDLAGTYQSLTNTDGTDFTVQVAAGKNNIIRPINLAGWRFVKVVSGSAEAADRIVKIMARHVE